MEKRILHADKRVVNTKHSVREIREQGDVPGVLYGKKIGSIPVRLFRKDLAGLRLSQLVQISLAKGESYPAMVREIQKEPLSGTIRHIDFQQIDLSEKIRAAIPVQITGEPRGVEEGGVVQLGERIVEVETLPAEMPAYLEGDITDLDIGAKYTAADLQKTTPLKIVSDLQDVLAVVVAAPRTVEEETTEAPEVPGVQAQEEENPAP